MRRLERRNKKLIKESNAAEWKVIKEQAHSEKLSYLKDVNSNSQPSFIDDENTLDLSEIKIGQIINSYSSKIKKRKTTRLQKLFGNWIKESFCI